MTNSIIQSRINFDKMGEIYDPASEVLLNKEIIEGIECYWLVHKERVQKEKIVIYLHGGCFVMGSILSHHALVSHLANEIRFPFLFIEYSLAPEKPFPAAINDVTKVYGYLLSKNPESDFIFIGDSAGAGLAISVFSEFKMHGLKSPESMVMISPWIDLSCSGKTITENADKDPVLRKERLLELVDLYIDNQDLSLVNPKNQLGEKLPPILILVGSNEILLDDSKLLYDKMAEKHSDIKLSIYDNQPHVWLLENIQSEQSQKAIMEIKDFLE